MGRSPGVILLPWLFDNESRLFCILDVSLPIDIRERDIDEVITEAVEQLQELIQRDILDTASKL